MMLRPLTALHAARTALIALLACAAPALPAQAGAYTFSTPSAQRTINAGIVLVDSTTNIASTTTQAAGPSNPDPYPFYILSRRVDLLPAGWTIKNPLAPHNVSATAQARWDARTGTNPAGTAFMNSNGGHAYQFGQNLTPGMAAYWEVSLDDASTQSLQQFDVLLINLAPGDIAKFRPAETEKLRRFVDGGGTLLVEDTRNGNISDGTAAAPAPNAYGPLFFPLQFTTSATPGANLPSLLNRHPIISAPYYLAQNELNALGNGFTGDIISTAPIDPELISVLLDGANKPVVKAKSYGAGSIVVTSTGMVEAINNAVTASSITTRFGSNSGPYCGTNFQASPTQDLKFLCNIISWGGGHSHEYQNSHQTGETLSAVPSAVRSWNFAGSSAANVPGAAISGSFVYSMDSAGVLHAFDLYPSEDLDGNGNPDDGDTDYGLGKSYDQVWQAPSAGASAPTVATVPVAGASAPKSYVFVEGANGKINQYATGTTTTPTPTSVGPPTSPGTFPTGQNTPPIPSPTYYEGRLYASEPDGSLFINDFEGRSAAGGKSIKLDANLVAVPTGSPVVGALASTGTDSGATPQSTDIVAMVPTDNGLYSLFLGARGEALRSAGTTFTATHAPNSATIDASFPLHTYSLLTGGYAKLESAMVTGTTFTFTSGPAGTPVYADYDMDFSASTTLTRTLVTFGSNNGSSTGRASTPALGRLGPIVDAKPRLGSACFFSSAPGATAYTVLSSFYDATAGAALNWRFRIPQAAGIVDADGVDYSSLIGFEFQGKPVIDSRGYVYALATDGTHTAILCFNDQQVVTTASLPTDAGTATLTQTEFTPATPLLGNQYSQPNPGDPLTLRSFGAAQNTGPTQLVPNLNEPEPLTVTLTPSPASAGGSFPLALHTNLLWYSIVKTNVVPPPVGAAAGTQATGTDISVTLGEGLAKVGNALYFVGQAAGSTSYNLFSVPADPQTAGFAITNKNIPIGEMASSSTQPAYVTDSGDTGVDATSAVVSAAGGALIVNGSKGVSAFLNRTTLVTDSSRVMELYQDGSAAWLVDSTQGNIGLATSSLELSRPSSVTELTPNDYLVADTGNNRAVRFDRAGKVVWELSRFNDTFNTAANPDPLTLNKYGKSGPFLSASEPSTLNQPTSVQIQQHRETANGAVYNVVHYLVSDTGNFRILDIVDVYDANGNSIGTPHNLVWISHTYDKQQRQYRYQSAAYFSAPNGTSTYIVALVANQRVAQPPTNPAQGVLASSAQDAPGGSLVLLDYDPGLANTGTQKNGYIATVIDHVQAYITNAQKFDLPTALANAGAPTTPVFGGSPTTLYIRNPRYLKAYTPAGSATTLKGPNLLLADDNGVFDLAYDVGTPGVNGRPAQYFTQWGFTQADYQALHVNPSANPAPAPDRANIPFVPQSLQRTGTDSVAFGGKTYSIGRYLAVNGYSKGDPGNQSRLVAKGDPGNLGDILDFGGEVFELSVAPRGGALTTDIINTLDRVSNSSPLVQPTFAYRLQ